MNNIAEQFDALGATFVTPPAKLREKLNSISVYIFDWDGVFTSGRKDHQGVSSFSEADSMGVNLLRFGHWLRHKVLPKIVILSGENNPTAFYLAQREHFDAVYYKFKNKKLAVDDIYAQYSVSKKECAFCFDDVLDLPVVQSSGMNFLVRRDASALFMQYVTANNHCDYVTGNSGGCHAVREISELLLGVSGIFEQVIDERVQFSDNYRAYLEARNKVETTFFTEENKTVIHSNINIV